MLLAWAIEAACGWPDGVYRRIRHPVVWIGWLVERLERTLNREPLGERGRLLAGALASGIVIFIVVAIAWALACAVTALLPAGPPAKR